MLEPKPARLNILRRFLRRVNRQMLFLKRFLKKLRMLRTLSVEAARRT
jgi:hypothetical protein